MKASADSIVFDYHNEIGILIDILEEWLADHGENDIKTNMAEELRDRLDCMSMEW